jgi:hypothetical protein
MKRIQNLAFAVALALVAGTAQAGLINPGFEEALTGWSTSSGVIAAAEGSKTTDYADPITYDPVAGDYFLVITAGDVDVWQTVFQSVALAAGQTLSGWAAFDWQDYRSAQCASCFFDGARVQILDSSNSVVATPFYMDGTGKPDGYNGPWTEWSWTALVAGTYTLEYAARNTGDNSRESFGYFDAEVMAVPQVPEPTPLTLLALGLAGLALVRRRKA